MRITHQMLSRNYLKRMNTNLKGLASSNERMSSQRAYHKAYENVADAGKALRVRKLMGDNERSLAAVRDARGRAAAAEESVRTVNALMITAKDRVTQGLNGTVSAEDRGKIAVELERAQDEVLQIMNSQFADNFLFNASGNADGSAPFTVKNGRLAYNGTAVDEMVKDPATGSPSTRANGEYTPIPWNTDNYIDIGFGYRLDDTGNAIDPNTAHKNTFSGVESFGYGRNADGVPLNAWSLLGRMAANLRGGHQELLEKDLNAIGDSMNFMLTTVTEMGARGVTLENTQSRLESEYVNLADTQNELEGIDLSNEAINNKSYEMSWLVTLQLGSRILPQTIFDFLR